MFKRTFLKLLAAVTLAGPALAFDPGADPWVLFCHTDPSESRIGEYTDKTVDLKLEAKTAGAVARGWYGSTCTLYGKLVATKLDGTVVADLPAAPNYIMNTVSLGPVPAGGDRPSIVFTAGATLTSGVFKVEFEKGRLVCWATGYPNPKLADSKNLFALKEWRFMVIRESEAKKWREGLKVRASLYSME